MNDLSGSPSLRKICNGSAHLRDAWWEKGFGFGFTFSRKGMWFRLDHVLYSTGINVISLIKSRSESNFSDHKGLITYLKFC